MRQVSLLVASLLAMIGVFGGNLPAQAIDPVTAAYVASALVPSREYAFKPSLGVARAHWYVNNQLRGIWSESSGQVCMMPNIGQAIVPVHFANSAGKGIAQAWVTENAKLDLRQDKPGSRRSRERDSKRTHGETCECQECLVPELIRNYQEMAFHGKSWYFTLDLWKLTPGIHTYRTAFKTEGGKESTYRGPLGIGKTGRFKAIENEGYVELVGINFLDHNGKIQREFCDPGNEDCLNYAAIFAACPGLQPVDAKYRLPVQTAPVAPFVSGLMPPKEDQKVQREMEEVEETESTTRTGTNRWLKVVNQLDQEVEFSVQWKNGANSTAPQTLTTNGEQEIELPTEVDSTFTVFVRRAGGKFAALPNRVDGSFSFPSPAVGKGIRVKIDTAPSGA